MALAAEIDRAQLCSHLGFSFATLLEGRDDLNGFIAFLGQFGRVVTFGGFVRDAIHNFVHPDKQDFRDVDLVLIGGFRSTGRESKNHFGGYRRCFADGLKIDYWTLESTYAFSRGLFEPSLGNLPLTTVFTINACAFDPGNQQLYENQSIEAIVARRISFNCTGYLDVFPQYQAFRAIDFAERLNYSIDSVVMNFIQKTMRERTLQSFINAVRDHRPDVTPSRLRHIYEIYR